MPLHYSIETRPENTSPDDRILARSGFGSQHEIGADPRFVTIGLPCFDASPAVECWRSERSVETGQVGDIAFASDGRFLFGHLHLAEAPGSCLEVPAYHAYTSILNSLNAFGGLHLLRAWNYVDAINEDQAGLERYRSFCVGRSRAFADQDFPDQTLPAATGVGATASGLMISFLAAADPGQQIENPRQVSAFNYPERYGPRSPSFSRALIYNLVPEQTLLFISGTASIVGHETVHIDDLEAQFEETCRNLDAVSQEAVARSPWDRSTLRSLRLYVRHEEHAEAAIAMARRHFGEQLPIISLKSNICRKDLLLEIEGVASILPSDQRVA